MCFFEPTKKRRYHATTYEDPPPRKRRANYQQAIKPVHYDPLRGYGVKRDPPSAAAVHKVLRGQGVKRDPPQRQSQHTASLPPMEYTHAQTRQAGMHGSSRHRQYHRAERVFPASGGQHDYHLRRSHPVSTERTISSNYNPFQYDQIPELYYFDTPAVRSERTPVMHATIHDTTRPSARSRGLRRHRGQSHLRH
jgi:hypothetical protein